MTAAIKVKITVQAYQKFITGIDYWPANMAMYWWRNLEAREVEEDFKRLVENKFQLVRIFLTWEDFQVTPRNNIGG